MTKPTASTVKRVAKARQSTTKQPITVVVEGPQEPEDLVDVGSLPRIPLVTLLPEHALKVAAERLAN